MKLKVLRKFRDREAGVLRRPGDVFDVTEERAEQLRSAFSGTLVEPVAGQMADIKPVTGRRKKTPKGE